ncbi:hypothetical protein QBC46DRAFT_372531 [Diplogelasinospora grovesii]|uniref:Uncharacterized protein n=1 Tax=Diplogelasinospora grovesii TaxID=303347 RepID=A0AAN6S943_9PEZI|nr:hypothetical protein QBC46DRAFT_372531 [Diplogelasinospora grovesii]
MNDRHAPRTTVRKRRVNSDAPDPIEATANWLDGLLKENTAEGRRVMSPTTEANVRALLEAYQQAGNAPPETRAELIQAETLTTIRREIDRRLVADAKYAEARWKLEKLEKDAWFLRYGDYHATTLGAVWTEARRIAEEAKAEASAATSSARTTSPVPVVKTPEELALADFLSQPWITIDQTLRKEEVAAAFIPPGPPPTPMTDLVKKLISFLPDAIYQDVRSSIALYAHRNSMAQGHAGTLASSRKFYELAGKLNTDLVDLMRKRDMSEEVRESTRVAIVGTIALYFKDFERDELSGEPLVLRAVANGGWQVHPRAQPKDTDPSWAHLIGPIIEQLN